MSHCPSSADVVILYPKAQTLRRNKPSMWQSLHSGEEDVPVAGVREAGRRRQRGVPSRWQALADGVARARPHALPPPRLGHHCPPSSLHGCPPPSQGACFSPPLSVWPSINAAAFWMSISKWLLLWLRPSMLLAPAGDCCRTTSACLLRVCRNIAAAPCAALCQADMSSGSAACISEASAHLHPACF
jgi:hypothetical protein